MTRRPFSPMSAGELLDFAHDRALDEIGGNTNAWLGLIDVAKSGMNRTPSARDRRLYRMAALLAIDGAHAHGGLSKYGWARKTISTRASYLLKSKNGAAWKTRESLIIYEIFIQNVTMDYESIAGLLATPIDSEDPAKIMELLDVKYLLAPVVRVMEYLPTATRSEVERWVSLLEGIR